MNRPITEGQRELLEKIKGETEKGEISTVSFRMWDTLVLTPFSVKSDLFVLMEDYFKELSKTDKSFTELRIQAEESAEKKIEKGYTVTIESIYEILRKVCKTGEDVKKKLIEKECELIEKYSFARECGKELFESAKGSKKRVLILADTIYPRDTVNRILKKCGYSSSDEVIIPQEMNIQGNQSIMDTVIKKGGSKASRHLHIGGDVEKDVETPIIKGAKALLLSPVVPLMVKSGRFRGYVQSQKLFDYESEEYFILRCIFGLYACYGFDIPQNKQPHSDFCNDKYMLGFIVLGSLSLDEGFEAEGETEEELIRGLESDEDIRKGKEDFCEMFGKYFGDIRGRYKAEGSRLGLIYLENHSSTGDRSLLKPYISDSIWEIWSKNITDPDIVPVYARTLKKNAVSKFADKLFPQGTKVRTITDRIMGKLHL